MNDRDIVPHASLVVGFLALAVAFAQWQCPVFPAVQGSTAAIPSAAVETAAVDTMPSAAAGLTESKERKTQQVPSAEPLEENLPESVTAVPGNSAEQLVEQQLIPPAPQSTAAPVVIAQGPEDKQAATRITEPATDSASTTVPEADIADQVVSLQPPASNAIESLTTSQEVLPIAPPPSHPEEREVRYVRMPASAEWFSSGITAHEGDEVEISASGNIRTAGYSVASGPDGQRYVCDTAECVMRNERFGVLLARVGRSAVVVCGHRRSFRAASTGELRFAINDKTGTYSDNQGSLAIRIIVSHPSN